MDYVFSFILISWWNGQHMRVDELKFETEALCNETRHRQELILKEQAERSDGSFIYAVGDCKVIVIPSET